MQDSKYQSLLLCEHSNKLNDDNCYQRLFNYHNNFLSIIIITIISSSSTVIISEVFFK